MPSPLENLAASGQLHPEPVDEREYDGLVASGRKRLADAGNGSLSLEGRFDLAYNAAHALCLAALRRAGFRPVNRYIVFQTLPHTLGLGPEVWRVLAKAHQKRNDAEYEGFVDVEERLVDDVIGAAHAVGQALDALPPM
ncbi:MAG: hypothetical protein LJF06_06235 [Gemmatimonadetes bacterium]|nr:hypothetical protein [Gemmatimonadota bacterium]